jgi:hypothetical protein
LSEFEKTLFAREFLVRFGVKRLDGLLALFNEESYKMVWNQLCYKALTLKEKGLQPYLKFSYTNVEFYKEYKGLSNVRLRNTTRYFHLPFEPESQILMAATFAAQYFSDPCQSYKNPKLSRPLYHGDASDIIEVCFCDHDHWASDCQTEGECGQDGIESRSPLFYLDYCTIEMNRKGIILGCNQVILHEFVLHSDWASEYQD